MALCRDRNLGGAHPEAIEIFIRDEIFDNVVYAKYQSPV